MNRQVTEIDGPSFWGDLRTIFSALGGNRRLQLAATFFLMFVGAMAELVTIGAVLPFLAFAAGGDYAARIPVLNSLLQTFHLQAGSNLVVPAATVLIVASIVAALLRMALVWMTQKFVYGVQYDLTMIIYGRTLRQPYEMFVRQNSSTVLSGLEKIHQAVVGVINFGLIGITSAGMAAFIIAFLFVIDPVTATVAATLMGTLYIGISLVIRRLALLISQRASFIRTARIKLLQESLGGLRDIILDRSESVFERKLSGYEMEMRRLQSLSNFVVNSPRFVVEASGITLVALLAIYFSFQPGGMLVALPVLGALALGAQRLLPMLQAIYLGWTNYAVNAHVMHDVVMLLRTPVSESRIVPRDSEVRPFRSDIVLRRLGFSYGSAVAALTDIDLTIRKGERIGLIGQTGSGKSTLVDVLMGLLRPTEGEILLDAIPLDNSNIGNWQAQVAHVPQAIFLADDTIAANIAFGAGDTIDLDRVWQAARRADVAEFIEQLPNGMMTEVGERGVRLSGGQRQRIGIARALYKNATVLILDEATSALDDNTEAAVMAAVTDLDRDLTIIMIAHRLSTVRACDTIYRLHAGKIIQSGSYQDVVLDKPVKSSGKSGI